MKLDKFTWVVIGVVLLLVIAAVVTVNVTGGEGVQVQEYMAPDTPEAPVFNAFLALQRGDLTTARAQYSQEVLASFTKDGYDQLAGRSSSSNSSQRLRITQSEIVADDADLALVSFVIDTYGQGGLFGSGSTWSRDGVIEVVHEDNGWKINSQEFFW